MNDYFARIGLALEELAGDTASAATLALIAELKASRDNLTVAVNERVQAAAEALAGRLDALEAQRAKTDTVVFSTSMIGALLGEGQVTDKEKEIVRDVLISVAPLPAPDPAP